MNVDLSQEAVKLAPPAVVSGTVVYGIPLNEWVYLLTLVYLAVQIGVLIYKTFSSKNFKD